MCDAFILEISPIYQAGPNTLSIVKHFIQTEAVLSCLNQGISLKITGKSVNKLTVTYHRSWNERNYDASWCFHCSEQYQLEQDQSILFHQMILVSNKSPL